jgi:hypothetical protein
MMFISSQAKVSVPFLMPFCTYPTVINENKQISIVLIQLRWPIFGISPVKIQLRKGEVIPATRLRHTRVIGTFYSCSPNSAHPLMKIIVIISGKHWQHLAVYILQQTFSLSCVVDGSPCLAPTAPSEIPSIVRYSLATPP